MSRLFTSESVTEGHPDKIADQISDAIVDAVMERDPGGRVACETLVTTGLALVAGEMRSGNDARGALDIPALVRETLRAAGYTRADYGIDGDTCAVLTTLDRQSAEIAAAVDAGEGDDAKPLGAGDQGMMFGFACDDTPELMPAPISVAHALVRGLSRARNSGEIPWLRPDGKSQVTFEYGDDWRPRRIRTVVLSAQHDKGVPREEICRELMDKVVRPALPGQFLPGGMDQVTFHINPSGSFVLGGPHGDAGLTGRKIIVDTYGGFGRHGGGAFSGKDATKVDRSGAYAARWAARTSSRPARRSVASPARLCDRRRRARTGMGGLLRHRRAWADRPGPVGCRARGLRLPPRVDHPGPRTRRAGLPAHGGFRALRQGAAHRRAGGPQLSAIRLSVRTGWTN